MHRLTATLLVLLALSIGLKQAFAGRPAIFDAERLNDDLAAVVAPAGYRPLLQQPGGAGLTLERGNCRARIAVLDLDGAGLTRERSRLRVFPNRAEVFGSGQASDVPARHWIGHYTARMLARLDMDRPAVPYLLIGWGRNCPAPARDLSAIRAHYRRG